MEKKFSFPLFLTGNLRAIAKISGSPQRRDSFVCQEIATNKSPQPLRGNIMSRMQQEQARTPPPFVVFEGSSIFSMPVSSGIEKEGLLSVLCVSVVDDKIETPLCSKTPPAQLGAK